MKGFFNLPEATYTIDIQGESWRQGDSVQLSVTKELKDQDLTPSTLTVAHVDLKKLAKQDPKALVPLHSCAITEPRHDLSIALDLSCPISDKSKATMVFLGHPEQLTSGDRLELLVKERALITNIIDTLSLFYRFKLASLKNKGSKLDAKFKLPASSELAAVDQLNLIVSGDHETIALSWHFKIKKLAYTAEGVKAQKEVSTFDFTYPIKDLMLFGDSLNQELIKKDVDTLLASVKTKSQL